MNDRTQLEDMALQDLLERRNRIVMAVRDMVLPVGIDPNEAEILFISGGRFDMNAMQTASALARETGCDILFVEFAEGQAYLRVRSIHILMERRGTFRVIRNGDLWVDQHCTSAVIVPRQHIGQLIDTRDELVHLPQKPEKRELIPGFSRARGVAISLAASMSPEQARQFHYPARDAAA